VAAGLQPAESGLQADRPQRDVKAIRIWAGYKPAPTGQLEPRANWNHGPTGTTGQLEPRANWNHGPTGTTDQLEPQANWNHRPTGTTGQLEPQANWNHRPTGTTGQLDPTPIGTTGQLEPSGSTGTPGPRSAAAKRQLRNRADSSANAPPNSTAHEHGRPEVRPPAGGPASPPGPGMARRA
jgi:hypothetical protein